MKFRFFACSLLLFSLSAQSQTSPQLSSSEIKNRLQRLSITGSVLYIAAHPDDENTRLLSYLVSERKLRTGYLSLTRGDGGQNLIGSEQAEQLGLIRTQELLAARRIDGAEQFFSRANDFGFSKTADETFNIWNKERILSDVVWVIRKFQPDVIITRFPGDSRAGHGHHAASSILAQEAFLAAADPRRFPDQLRQVKVWQTKRIFWNTFNFGTNNTTSEDQLKINVGKYNSLLGKSYGEIASESRSQHKSQGFGVARQRGDSYEYFSLLKGPAATEDILEGVTINWSRVQGAAAIQELSDRINRDYDIEKPSNSVPALLDLYALVSKLEDSALKKDKLNELKELILCTSGTWFEAYSAEPSYAVGESIKIKIQAISHYGLKPSIRITGNGNAKGESVSLAENQLNNIETEVKAGSLTQPYWLEQSHPTGEYIINDRAKIGFAENPDPLSISFELTIQGKTISFERPVVYKFTDPIRGEVYRNLEITPPVIANLQQSQLIFTDNKPQRLSVKLKALKDNSRGNLKLGLPEGWKTQPSSIPFELKDKSDELTLEFQIEPKASASNAKLKAEIHLNGDVYSKSLKTIQYNHIPAITYFPEAEMNLVKLDLKTAGKKIAYIPGAGDLIPEALRQVGYEVTLLNENQVLNSDLSRFDAIITGVRLYNIQPRMKFMNNKLLKYVEDGGVLLVQYNVNQPLVIKNIGPYPFTISRDRTTEEDTRVSILNPNHRLFNYPNKITENDFSGWIQERGIYYLSDTDGKYESLLAMNDQGETEKKGALVVGNYGKGRFVYTGLAFFRQLPAGVPGAYRLFVNLISK